MVKAYQRYEPTSCFGVICSAGSNTVYSKDGKYAIAPALEEVLVWDLKKGECVKRWYDMDNHSQITCIQRSPNGNEYAIGYSDGSIRVYDIEKENTPKLIFNGHRGAISALRFDPTGTVLCSGSRDTDIVLWDMVGETGLFRLKGHKDQITGCLFISNPSESISAEFDSTNENFKNQTNNMDIDTNGYQHKTQVSAFTAGSTGYLVTSSKDTLLKVWDLESRHCVQTVVSHKSEVWSIALSPDQKTLVTGSSESFMRVYDITISETNSDNKSTLVNGETEANGKAISNLEKIVLGGSKHILKERGLISRQSKERVSAIQFHPSGIAFGCQTNDRKNVDDPEDKEENIDIQDIDHVKYEFTSKQILRLGAKTRSFDFNPAEFSKAVIYKQASIKILFSLSNNSIHVATLSSFLFGSELSKPTTESIEPQWHSAVERLGHRSEPRCIALSNDNELLATACTSTLRIWNVATNSCLRTLDCSQSLCVLFLPGDQYIAVGTKKGTIEIYDLAGASHMGSYEAHDGGCYSIAVKSDKTGIVSGGGDKEVKFWNFELVENKETYPVDEDGNSSTFVSMKPRQLSLVHTRTLKLPDVVLSVALSADGKLIAVSLLDTTIKIFYVDSLKFYLSLYGHKLPALSIDISSDSTLLVSGSADKNIKIWGLDFGDCHKSIFAHKDAVTSVKFVWDTHYFFSGGKDGAVTMWDGDKFVKVQTMPQGAHGDIWGIALGKFGNFVAGVSQDRTVRVWNKTEEPLFLEEERERELEEFHEQSMVSDFNKASISGKVGLDVDRDDVDAGVSFSNINRNDDDDNLNEEAGDASGVSGNKQTLETLKAGERIVEAINLVEEEISKKTKYEKDLEKSRSSKYVVAPLPPTINTTLQALKIEDPEVYLLRIIEKIRLSELEDALLALPLSKFPTLLACMNFWTANSYNVQLTTRVLVFLLRSNIHQVNNMKNLRPHFIELRENLRGHINGQKRTVGVNLSNLRCVQKEWELNATKELFDEQEINAVLEKTQKKRKFIGPSTR
ncbi:hypothetical protein BB559_000141 [Furculomyces boomerangus]|uniref:Small-subunit processome Utp12 domain-containing protein n=1 Tax=Furculomyces boomerangus TaxID=61424 RepID=A0A2T9Z684_9FUNG|nr:hypothetical protein BB559_000141 [Furculomyces boomerangus]